MVLDRTIHIGFPNVTGMTDITSDIEAGSVTLSEVLFARFAFGSYSAGKMEFIMYNLTDVAEEKLHVWITNSNNVITDVFTGYVESCKLDNLGHFRKVVAYDEMYWKRDTDVSQWWNTFWASRSTATLAEIRGSLCTYVGFTQVSGTHFNDNLSIKKKNEIGMIRFSDILTYLCELQCTFPNMARDGRIEFVSLDPAKVSTHSDVALEQAQCAFEDFTTAAISQIVVTLDNEVVYRTATNDRSVYSVQNNIFLYDYTNTEIGAFADAFLTEAAKITYVPATLTLVCSDLSVKLGDIITTSHGNCRVFQNDLSGALLVNQEVRATGEKTLAQVRGSYDVTYANLSQRVANTVDELHTNYMTAETINATFVAADDLEADVVTAGFIKADEVASNYAQINLANVNNAWIQNGAIKDAAIGDAQIAGVSANKLTAGTIDASNITVTNLNASNISAGSLSVGGVTIDVGNNTAAVNGSAITSGSIPLSGLSSEVVDKIEGAIETFTSNAVPTLNNYPASSWTTSAQKDEHVGDICYVVNSALSQDGFCYRFSKSGSTYSWQLIKDSDVTAALQDISDLQTFETNTSQWITQTDGEISSLQSRTTTVEGTVTSINQNAIKTSTQLWYTKSNTTAPAKPTSKVTSTSTSGNAWRVVVPSYNSSYPNYYYCWQYEYQDGHFDWSAVVRDIAMGETQSTARNASDAASTAQTTADNAATAASTAQTTADNAATAASTAQTTANSAATAASAAQTTADGNVKSSAMLWFTNANTTAPAKPTAHVTSTSTDGNAWRVVVPIYNASYPYYFYCYEYQKGDGTYFWGDVVYDRATTENQANSRSALTQVSTKVEQSTFNSLSATVDANTASITTLTTKTETALDGSIEYITGTQTEVTGDWTGVTRETSLKTGKTIAYKLPYNGSGNASLTLTLANGTDTAAIPVYINNSRVTTHYTAGTVVKMTYDGSSWRTDNYDSNTYDRTRFSSNIYAISAITAGRIICGTSAGYVHIGAGVAFDLSYPLLYAASDIAAAANGTNNYIMFSSTKYTNNGTVQSGAAKKVIYLKGTVSGTTFTIASTNFLTTVIPTAVDNFYYIPLGVMTNTTTGTFSSTSQLWTYMGGSFQQASASVVTTTNTVNTVQQTANTNSATISTLTTVLGTNADGSTKTGDVMHRMTTAESNITQNANDITLKVSESDVTGDYVVGKINLNSTTATIAAEHVNLQGSVAITDLTSAAQGSLIVETKQLWFAKANTTAPAKPTAEVTSTTTTGNAWRVVVPVYTSSYPYFFYCYQYKYANGTFGWSSVVFDRQTHNATSAVLPLYYRSTSSTAPAKPTTSTTISTDTNTDNTWTWNIPKPKKGTYFFTCQRNSGVSGTTFSDVRKMDDITSFSDWSASANATYIDGGNIYTGTVTADKINVSDLEALNATIAGWNIGQNEISKSVQVGTDTRTAYISTSDYYAFGCESAEQGYARISYDGKIDMESSLDRNEGRLSIRNVSEHYAGETYADGGYVVCREPYDSTQYPELKIAAQLGKGFVTAEYKEYYSAPDFPQTNASAVMSAPNDASGEPYVVVRKDIDESASSQKSDVAWLFPTSLQIHSDDNPVFIELLGSSAEITLNGDSVLTDAIIPTTTDSDWTNDTSNDTSLHYTNAYMTVPSDGMYAVAAEAEYVASAPQELAVITWSQSGGVSSIEQICRQENASLYTSKFLHCGTTADLKGGYIIQIYVRYNGTGTNRVRLRIRKLL